MLRIVWMDLKRGSATCRSHGPWTLYCISPTYKTTSSSLSSNQPSSSLQLYPAPKTWHRGPKKYRLFSVLGHWRPKHVRVWDTVERTRPQHFKSQKSAHGLMILRPNFICVVIFFIISIWLGGSVVWQTQKTHLLLVYSTFKGKSHKVSRSSWPLHLHAYALP